MISFTSKQWEGLEGLDLELLRELKPKATRLMFDVGTRFQAELKTKLTGKRSGRMYKKPHSQATYIASAPGEAPASPTGALRNSMGFSKPKWAGWTVSIEVGSGLGVGGEGKISPAYARRMEFGGIDSRGVRIAARPYMAPTAEKMEPILARLFEAKL